MDVCNATWDAFEELTRVVENDIIDRVTKALMFWATCVRKRKGRKQNYDSMLAALSLQELFTLHLYALLSDTRLSGEFVSDQLT